MKLKLLLTLALFCNVFFINATNNPSNSINDVKEEVLVNEITCSVSSTSFCSGTTATVTFTASGVYNSGNVFTAQLSNATGSFTSPVNLGSLTAITSGTISGVIPNNTSAGTGYRIRVIASNPSTIGTDNGVNITVNQLPNPILSGNQNICAGSTSTFSSTVAGGVWSSSIPIIATVNSATGDLFGVSQGTAVINYTVTGVGGCPNVNASRTVTISAIPYAGVISGNQNICAGATSVFTSTISGGIWSSTNTSIATVNSSTGVVIGLSPGTTTISYNVQGTGGCPNTMVTLLLTVSQVATPAFSSVPQICSGTVLSPLPTTSINGITGTWSPALNNTATTLYTFTPTLGQCAISTSLAVTVNPLPFASISGGVSVCSGTSGRFNINGTPNATVTYNKNGGSNETIILDSSGSATIFTPQLFANSVYSLVSITSALTSCSIPVTGSATIVVNPLPIANSSPNNLSICSGAATNINLSSTQIGTIFDWVVVSTNVTGGSAGYGNVIKQVLQTSGNQQGTVVYTITPSTNGCVGIPIKTTVTINPLPLLEPMPNVIACSSYTLPQLLEGSYYTGPGGTGALLLAGDQITTSTMLSVSVINGFCSASYPHSITIITEPKPEIVTENNSNEIYIDNTTVVQPLLLDSQLTNEYSFQWYENGIAIDGATSSSFLVNTVSQNANPRNFTLEVFNKTTGCIGVSPIFAVNQIPVPAPSGNRLQSFTQGQTLADLEVEGSNIQWYADRTGNKMLMLLRCP